MRGELLSCRIMGGYILLCDNLNWLNPACRCEHFVFSYVAYEETYFIGA